MKKIYFASSNEKKFLEIKDLCTTENIRDLNINFKKIDVVEIQTEVLRDVAEDKVKKAFYQIQKPVIVEDDGLFIKSLKGFPGVYSSFVFKTLGNDGILDVLKKKEDRNSTFLSIISYYDGNILNSFSGEIRGHITKDLTSGGWGFDPIFIPNNSNKTFGEMDIISKNNISHRRTAFLKFYEWYINKKMTSI